MKKMSKKVAALALAGLMAATPIANFTGLNAEAATVKNRTVKVNNVPNFVGLQGYDVYLYEAGGYNFSNSQFGLNGLLGSTKKNGSFKTKTSLKDTSYYAKICYKNVGDGHVLPKNCYTTNTVTINSKKLKKADLEISVKKNGIFSSNAKATLKVNY